MQIEGKYEFDAPPERVYAALLDPAILASCMPGCEKLEASGADTFDVVLSVGVAAVKGRYAGSVILKDKNPPHSYSMEIKGSGPPGFVSGHAHFSITPQNGRSEIRVTSDVEVGGMIARVGQRVLGGVSKFMIGQFFDCLKKKCGGEEDIDPLSLDEPTRG